MDDYVVQQFFTQFKADMAALLTQPDYTSATTQIAASLTKIALILQELETIGHMLIKETLEGEAIKVLRQENVDLMARNTELVLHQRKIGMLLKDLSGPCLGCKKEAWRPHQPDCAWANVDEQLAAILGESYVSSGSTPAAE